MPNQRREVRKRELTGGGRSHPRDPRCGGRGSGPMIPKPRAKGVQVSEDHLCKKELSNGRANRRLAGDEQRWVSPRHWGRNGDREGNFGRLFPSYRRRRERRSGPGPARRRRSVDGLPVLQECGAASLPIPGQTCTWRGRFEADPGHCSTGPSPNH
jgi:hypothetical protein